MTFFADEVADDNCNKKQANVIEEDKDYEKVDRRRSPRLIQKLKRRRARSSVVHVIQGTLQNVAKSRGADRMPCNLKKNKRM